MIETKIYYGQLCRLIKTEKEMLKELESLENIDQQTLDDVKKEIKRLENVKKEVLNNRKEVNSG